jgi:histidyl-tRNA synthetase
LNEYELIRIIDEVFSKLGIAIVTKLNNRKILSGIAEYIGEGGKITDITVAIDKLDKIGIDAVNEELRAKGLSQTGIEKLQPVLTLKGSADEKLTQMEEVLSGSETGIKGISEIRKLFSLIEQDELKGMVEFDLTLARGLNYYTGAIIEVKSTDVAIGSICGGGRYDNLTGVFGMDGVSGVGISFGADRIYDVMNQLGLFGSLRSSSTDILILNFGDDEVKYAMKILNELRNFGVKSELYPDQVKLKKQMSYADSRKIPYIIIAGEEEIKNGEITIKNMSSGEQRKILLQNIKLFVKSELKPGI